MKNRGTGESQKAQAEEIFFGYCERSENDPVYATLKQAGSNYSDRTWMDHPHS